MTREEICHALRNIYSPEIMGIEYVAINAACDELKSGNWKTDEKGHWYCSECGLHYDSWAIEGFKYCPNCGAKMKKKTMTREEAIKMLVNATYSDKWQGNEDLTTANHMAIEALKQPKIIQCKDCKYWKYEKAINQSMCKNGIPSHNPDGFCHHAKPIE